MDRRQFSGGLAAFCLGLAGCRRTEPETEPDSDQQLLNVVATVGMVADLVRQIGGPRVQVTQLMGSGVDPHLYKATRDDLRLLMQADVIIAVGLMLEGRLQEVLARLKSTSRVVFAADQIPADLLLQSEESGDHPDPHVWMDVEAWSHCLAGITSALSAERPQYAAEFDSRARELSLELQGLHAYGLQSVATIPQDRRVLITSHDAFRYFGRAYGLEVMGLQGISTESEAGLLQVNAVVDLLVQRRISAVFIESSVPQKNMAALIEGAQARGHQVSIGGELYSDAMGEQGTWEGTYPGMLDHNITTITRSLGGQVPERGWAELRLKKGVQP